MEPDAVCAAQAFGSVASGLLDGPLAMTILRSLFPRETISGSTICAVCSALFRLVPPQQVFLLKWILMCFPALDDSGQHALRQLYAVFFSATEFEFLRYWAIRVLYTVRRSRRSRRSRARSTASFSRARADHLPCPHPALPRPPPL